jgi:hypothetical protein
MLLPEEIRPFIFHADETIRRFAMDYLGEAHDPAPLTVDDVWEAMDRVHGEERLVFAKYLGSVPGTAASTARILEGLRTEDDDMLFAHLLCALERCPAADVRLALADRKIARRLQASEWLGLRLVQSHAELSFDDLWGIVEDCEVDIKDGLFLMKPSVWWIHRHCDALARFPEQAAARALDVLLDASKGRGTHWLRIFSAALLGNVSHPATLVPLLAVARDRGALFIERDWVVDALVHLGTREVVEAAAADLSRGSHRLDWRATDVLERVKRPASEQALVRLLAATSDVVDGTRFGMALCALCTTSPEALDRLRALVNAGHFDPYRGGALDDAFLTVCAVHGFQPVEAPAWRKQRAERREALARASQEYEVTGDPPVVRRVKPEWKVRM